eukprot:COSAG06_NODE_13582_length_1242_cov_1.632546_3_plen_65_part_01
MRLADTSARMSYFFSRGSHRRQAVQVRRQDQGPRATNMRGYILRRLRVLEHYPLPIRSGKLKNGP